jgi:hypothetical protein
MVSRALRLLNTWENEFPEPSVQTLKIGLQSLFVDVVYRKV